MLIQIADPTPEFDSEGHNGFAFLTSSWEVLILLVLIHSSRTTGIKHLMTELGRHPNFHFIGEDPGAQRECLAHGTYPVLKGSPTKKKKILRSPEPQ